MKYIVVIVVIASVFNSVKSEGSHNHTEAVHKAETECAKEKGISLDVLAQAESGIFALDDKKLNCFAECLFHKLNFIKAGSDELVLEVMTRTALENNPAWVPITELCAKKKGENLCDTTYQVYRCFNEEVNKPQKQETTTAKNEEVSKAANASSTTSTP